MVAGISKRPRRIRSKGNLQRRKRKIGKPTDKFIHVTSRTLLQLKIIIQSFSHGFARTDLKRVLRGEYSPIDENDLHPSRTLSLEWWGSIWMRTPMIQCCSVSMLRSSDSAGMSARVRSVFVYRMSKNDYWITVDRLPSIERHSLFIDGKQKQFIFLSFHEEFDRLTSFEFKWIQSTTISTAHRWNHWRVTRRWWRLNHQWTNEPWQRRRAYLSTGQGKCFVNHLFRIGNNILTH